MIKQYLRKLGKRRCLRQFSNFISDHDTPYNNIKIFKSESNDIFENLALENIIFHKEELVVPSLMIWRNTPSIVYGKHQNPFKECYTLRAEEDNVPLARRQSGGGCVYHDLQNLCYSFFVPIYDKTSPLDVRETSNKIILDALHSLNIDAELSPRNDLWYKGKKFSGSAYELDLGGKIKRKKTLHHGTLMINVDIHQLWRYLAPKKEGIQSKGVDSVVSKVVNLKEVKPDLTYSSLSQALAEAFIRHYDWCEPSQILVSNVREYHPQVEHEILRLTKTEWIFNQTPEFTSKFTLNFEEFKYSFSVFVKKGIIKSVNIKTNIKKLRENEEFDEDKIGDFEEIIQNIERELSLGVYSYSKEGIRTLGDILEYKLGGNSEAVKIGEEVINEIIINL